MVFVFKADTKKCPDNRKHWNLTKREEEPWRTVKNKNREEAVTTCVKINVRYIIINVINVR